MLACSLLVPQKALHFLSFSTEVQDRNDLLAEHQFKQVRFMAIEDFVVLFAKSVYKVKISENTCLRGIFWCHKDSKSYNYISAWNNDHTASHPHQLTNEPLIEKMKLLNLTNLSEQRKKGRVLTMTFVCHFHNQCPIRVYLTAQNYWYPCKKGLNGLSLRELNKFAFECRKILPKISTTRN